MLIALYSPVQFSFLEFKEEDFVLKYLQMSAAQGYAKAQCRLGILPLFTACRITLHCFFFLNEIFQSFRV
jgi:hypothetical protein